LRHGSIAEYRHRAHRLDPVKRLSPLMLIGLAVAVAVAVLRRSEPDPIELWTPVDPS